MVNFVQKVEIVLRNPAQVQLVGLKAGGSGVK